MTALRENYIRYMRYRNYSPRTVKSYCNCLIQLSKYYHLSLDTLTRKQFVDYLYYQVEEKQVSAVYLNQLISAYKILVSEVLQREWYALNIEIASSAVYSFVADNKNFVDEGYKLLLKAINEREEDRGNVIFDMSSGKTTIGSISDSNVQTGANSSMTINKTIEKDNEIKTLGGGHTPPRVKKGEKILIVIGLLAIIVAIIVGLKEEIFAFFSRIL